MVIRLKSIVFFFLILLGMWFVYLERTILTPFILAGIFAYLFNPVVTFTSQKLKVPRTLSILIIYSFITCFLVLGGILLSSRIGIESTELRGFITKTLSTTQKQVKSLPSWLQPTANDFVHNLRKSRFFLSIVSGTSLLPPFSQAISRIISFLIFLFSAFYFLKDGDGFFRTIVGQTPEKYKKDIEILFQKINAILSGYLRGQIFLILLMASVTYLALLILGVRFAFLIALFSGFAEIVPVIGPLVAGGVAVLMALVTGGAHFGLTPVQAGVTIALVYFVLRQLEDYFVMPYVFGKITKLPPFIIFFAVVAGGHIAGTLGLVLAVPVAAILRLLMEFFLVRIEQKRVQGSE